MRDDDALANDAPAGADLLDDPAAARRAFAELRRELEREKEELLVHRGRAAGLSWVEIAACLEVTTKRAVHKKYAGQRGRR